MPGPLLVVDDEPQILQMISGILQDEGFEVITAPDGEAALKLVGEEAPDLVLLDIALPGMDGLEVLQELKRLYPFLPVVMISAYGSVENAVKATRLGAYDFIEKPPHADKILLTVRNGLELARLSEENRRLRQQAAPAREIIGKSEPIRKLREALNLVAPTNASVLITGRTAPARNWWPGRSMPTAAGPRGPSWRSTAPPFPKTSSKASSSATRRGPLPGLRTATGANSIWPTKAPCFWMKSAI
jgi:two-component system nitrogen regulation response regulator NtrX